MIESKLKSEQISKAQSPVQQPINVIQTAPSNAQLKNMNTGNITVDETNGIVYVKGKTRTIKLTGVLI